MIFVVDSNQILCDVTFSDHIVILFLYITFHRQFDTDIDYIVY